MSMGLDGIRPHPGFYARVWPRTVLPVNTMRVWWCNQSDTWTVERPANLVIGKSTLPRPNARKRVGEVLVGDITVHHSDECIMAVSLATTNGQYYQNLPDIGPKPYGSGWCFKAQYFDLVQPIPVDYVRQPIVELLRKEGRIENFAFQGPEDEQPGNLLQVYFLIFSLAGLQIVKNASDVEWPEWVP